MCKSDQKLYFSEQTFKISIINMFTDPKETMIK